MFEGPLRYVLRTLLPRVCQIYRGPLTPILTFPRCGRGRDFVDSIHRLPTTHRSSPPGEGVLGPLSTSDRLDGREKGLMRQPIRGREKLGLCPECAGCNARAAGGQANMRYTTAVYLGYTRIFDATS